MLLTLSYIPASFLKNRVSFAIFAGNLGTSPGLVASALIHGHYHSIIETFEPRKRFTDIQIRRPYRSWHHTHEFREVPGGTMIRDVVDYSLPFGILGAAVPSVFVRGRLKSIFDFRSQRVAELLAAPQKGL